MNVFNQKSEWGSGDAYEPYVGRWSRMAAREFLVWLKIPGKLKWLDVGCGTGALSQTIIDMAAPSLVQGIDMSEDYINYARKHITDSRARFDAGDAQKLPYQSGDFDAVVSGLALNFVPDPVIAVNEMIRVLHKPGCIAVYVWDYAGEMQFMRFFWDAAAMLDLAAKELDEGRRFPVCSPKSLEQLFLGAGLTEVETRAIDIPTLFHNFDDFWNPFLGAQGPAPAYLKSLGENHKSELRELVRSNLPIKSDGSIHMVARAWAVKGKGV